MAIIRNYYESYDLIIIMRMVMKMTIITKVMIWLVSEKQWVHSGGKEKHRGEVSKPEYRYRYKYTNMNYKYNLLMSLINFLPSGADGTDCSDRNRGLQVEVMCIWFKGDVMETIPSWMKSIIMNYISFHQHDQYHWESLMKNLRNLGICKISWSVWTSHDACKEQC